MKALINNFLRDEDGAVTVDWVVLTAAIVGLGLVIGTTVGQSTADLAETIGDEIGTTDITNYYTTGGGSGSGTGTGGTTP
jgi:Flp pilus assembly pilin Flp